MSASRKLTHMLFVFLFLIGFASVARAADPGIILPAPTVTKVDVPDPVIAGNLLTYTITATNPGPAAGLNFTVSDPLPSGTVFISAVASPGATLVTPAVGVNGTVTATWDAAGGTPAGLTPSGVQRTLTIVVRTCPNYQQSFLPVGAAMCQPNLSNTASASYVSSAIGTGTATSTVQAQSNLAIISSGAPSSVLAGNNVTYTLNVSNAGPSNSAGTVVTDTLPAGWSVVSATPSVGSCGGVGTGTASCNLGTLGAANQCSTGFPTSASIVIVAHVPAVSQPGVFANTATVTTANCLADPNIANNTTVVETTVTVPNLGAGPPVPATSEISDDKTGSVLFYNFYTSNASDPTQNNTRINLTNVHPNEGVAVHLFFVDGSTCSVADSFLCLTANQTASFLASDVDPGVSGYIVAIATDNFTGCPISFNYLIGSAEIKLTMSPRREARLEAESCAAEYGSPLPGCDPNSPTATLAFDGSPTGYNRLPRVLAASNIPAPIDSNSTLIVINRIGGNLTTGAATIGTLFGILYDDTETSSSFMITSGACQLKGILSNSFPRTVPRLTQAIPSGHSGWLKIWGTNDIGILGAMINQNINADSVANAFDGGHNLHKLKLTASVTLTIPIFPPAC
jgi:uncharacterized repeat protein (TIGR01451 family)